MKSGQKHAHAQLPLAKKQSSNEEISRTIDSARDSDLSYKSSTSIVREFMDAAANGNREKLERLLKSGRIGDINTTDANMKTALHYAVNEGRYKTL